MAQKRKNKPTSKSSATANAAVETAADTTTEAVVETAPADDDADLDAALAMLADESKEDEPAAETTTDEGENVALDTGDAETDEEVEIEPTDVDAALAALEDEDKSKKSSTKGTGKVTTAVAQRAWEDVAKLPKADLDQRVADTNAKKVVEKAQNLIAAIEGRKSKLSRYTKDAVKLLAKEGKVSGKSLTDMFQAEGLKEGTARAQSQQMTALFKIVGAAEPSPGAPRELVIADQGLVDELVKLAA